MPNEINPFDFNIDKFDSGFLGPITDSNFRTFLFTHNLTQVNPVIQTILGGNLTQDRGTEYDVSQSTFNVTDVPNLGTVANTPSVYNNLTNPRQVNIGRNLPSVNPEVAAELGGTVTPQNQGLGSDAATLINNNPSVVDVPNLQNVASTPSVYNDLTNPRQSSLSRNLTTLNPQLISSGNVPQLNGVTTPTGAGLGGDAANLLNTSPTVQDLPDLQTEANTPRTNNLGKNLTTINPEVASSLTLTSFNQAGRGEDYGIDNSNLSDDKIVDNPNVLSIASDVTATGLIPAYTGFRTKNLIKNPTKKELETWYPDYAYWFDSENDTYKETFGVPNTLKLGFVGNVEGWTYPNGMITTTYMIRDVGYFKQNNKYGPEKIVRYKATSNATPAGVETTPEIEVISNETGFRSYNYADSLGEKLFDQLLNRQLGVGIIPFSTIGSGINFRPDGELSKLDVIARKRRGIELLNRIKLNVIGDTIGRINIDPASLLSGGKLIELDYTITQRKTGTFGVPFTGGRTVNLNPLSLLSNVTGFNIPLSPLTESDLSNIFTFYSKRSANAEQEYLKSAAKASRKFLKRFKRKNNDSTSPPPAPTATGLETPTFKNQFDIPEGLLAKTGSATRKLIINSLDENKYTPVIENKGATVLKNFGAKVSNGNYLVDGSGEAKLGTVGEEEYSERKKNAPDPETSSITVPTNEAGFFGSTEIEKFGQSFSDELGFGPTRDLEDVYVDSEGTFRTTTYEGTNISTTPFDVVGTEKFNWRVRPDNAFKRGLLRYTQNIVNNNTSLNFGNGSYVGYFDSNISGINKGAHKTGSFVNQTLVQPSKGNQVRNARLDQNGNVDTKSGDLYCRSWTSMRKYDNNSKLIRKGGNWWNRPGALKSIDQDDLTMNWDGLNGGSFTNRPKFTWNDLNKYDGKMIPYMLSIENLAWKGSEHFEKLMDCEKGPNGGRIMWFPPYDIQFSDSNSVQWDKTDFIGRGEPIYTYNSAERTGTLDFTIVVDHPDVLNTLKKRLKDNLTDDILHSFFAGCDDETIRKLFGDIPKKPDEIEKPDPVEIRKLMPEPPNFTWWTPFEKELKYYFDNAYDNSPGKPGVKIESPIWDGTDIIIDSVTILDRENNLEMYEVNTPSLRINFDDWKSDTKVYPCSQGNNPPLTAKYKFLNYEFNDTVRDFAEWLVTTEEGKNTVIELNASTSPLNNEITVTDKGQKRTVTEKISPFNEELAKNRYDSLKNYIYAVMLLEEQKFLEKNPDGVCIPSGSGQKYCYYKENEVQNNKNRWKPFNPKSKFNTDGTVDPNSEGSIKNYNMRSVKQEFFSDDDKVVEADIGFCYSRARSKAKAGSDVNAIQAGNPCSQYGIAYFNNEKNENQFYDDAFYGYQKPEVFNDLYTQLIYTSGNTENQEPLSKLGIQRTNSYVSKKTRYVEVITKQNTNSSNCVRAVDPNTTNGDIQTHDGFIKCIKEDYKNTTSIANNTEIKKIEEQNKAQEEEYKKKVAQLFVRECDYFEHIKSNDPTVYTTLKERLKNFHPAFHSMTPEGLNSRLTFLLQCTRQGPQVIDPNLPNNMVFGRPPICVLRIGDFYHTKIVIDNINITYEPLLWDLNPEGIGVQPMLAKVNLGFKFIGGSSLGGPITQLQNAVSFNFFANTAIYEPATKYTKDKYNFIYGAFRSPEQEKNFIEGKDITLVQEKINKQDENIVNTLTEVKQSQISISDKKKIEKDIPKDTDKEDTSGVKIKKLNAVSKNETNSVLSYNDYIKKGVILFIGTASRTEWAYIPIKIKDPNGLDLNKITEAKLIGKPKTATVYRNNDTSLPSQQVSIPGDEYNLNITDWFPNPSSPSSPIVNKNLENSFSSEYPAGDYTLQIIYKEKVLKTDLKIEDIKRYNPADYLSRPI